MEGEYCQNHGLSGLGEFLVKELMKRGMIIEVDHLPRKGYKRAYELLQARAARRAEQDEEVDADELASAREYGGKYSRGKRYNPSKPSGRVRKAQKKRTRRGDSIFEAAAKSTLRSAGSQLGRSVVRSLLKGLFR